ncbi:MAG: hypothetical protein ACH350_02475 [Parachlamydiaceae bacterium]
MINQVFSNGSSSDSSNSSDSSQNPPPPNLLTGILGGYVWYLSVKLSVKLFGEPEGITQGVAITSYPYILSGVGGVLIFQSGKLVYDTALSVLGDRAHDQNGFSLPHPSAFDKIRQKTWKIITDIEQLEKKIDVIYSRVFNIRTEEEIRAQFATDDEYYSTDFVVMEVARKSFYEEMNMIFQITLPRYLAIRAVEKMGFTLIGSSLILSFPAIHFVCGIINRIGSAYIKAEQLKIKKNENQSQQNENQEETISPSQQIQNQEEPISP